MNRSVRFRLAVIIAAALTGAASADVPRLSDLGAAAPIDLARHDGTAFDLAECRGKVVVVSFFYAGCPDVCPTGNAKLVQLQRRLGDAFGREVQFVSITLDPVADDGQVLEKHAREIGAQLDGWAFLTGTPEAVRRVAHDYGVVFHALNASRMEHNTLASIIDASGRVRVQYLGVQFDPDEMLADVQALVTEGTSR